LDAEILESIRDTHIKNGWPGLAYHFIVLKNGNIYQINNFEDVTWHDTHNYDSIGVCVHGYFHPEYNETPTKEQLTSLDYLLDQLCTQHPEFPADFDDVKGHRERSSTACPGDLLFPKVVDYRTKLGDVSWDNDDSPVSEPVLRTTKILWDDGEGKRHEVEWYTREWFNEKTSAVSLKKDLEISEAALSVANGKLGQKDNAYAEMINSLGIIKEHVTTIQKSFSEFGFSQGLMNQSISTLKETINTLREAFETSYDMWEKERVTKDTKITILEKDAEKNEKLLEDLRNELNIQTEINSKDISTIPGKTITKEFFKLLINRR